MATLQIVLMLHVSFFSIQYSTADDPCNTINFLNDPKRSVGYETGDHSKICDNTLQPGWYRITSGAGDQMQTECIEAGYRCNTDSPIWLSNDGVSADEDIFPAEGVTVNRTAYASSIYECKANAYSIKIKGCQNYSVYYLIPTSGCFSAYCFGDKLPCPKNESSDTGFPPGCGTFPDFTRKPFVKSQLKEFNVSGYIFSNITFVCKADDLSNLYLYNVRWYIAELELRNAKQQNLTKTEIQNGDAVLNQEHWTSLFRPNFIVKCSLSTIGREYVAPGPENFSEAFFAGIKANQSEYTVSETKSVTIPVQLTIPIPCGWPANSSDVWKKRFKDQCHLNLLNGIPRYQQDTSLCADSILDEGLAFDNQLCGISFTHNTWNETTYINITGTADNLVNLKDRIVFLRLYNNPRNSLPNKHYLYMFTGITLPDLKVIVHDEDIATISKVCKSVNDPHMYTFDNAGESHELQWADFGEGEFIMYQHNRLPLQINAYFRHCNSKTALCNCGLAVRSGDSLFIANFCETTLSKGGIIEKRVNRYIVEKLCDEESLIVTETGNKIKITLPTGTQVEFSHGKVYHFYGLHTISIYPSSLDRNVTVGLCGKFNGNKDDDLTPRNELSPTKSWNQFAKSWKINKSNKNLHLTLFDPSGKLPKTQYFGQEYCTCKVNGTTYPYENPYFKCELTSAMRICRSSRTTTSIIKASCSTTAYTNGRSKRSTENDDEEDQFPNFPLYSEDAELQNETVEWQNNWTEESAREFCTKGIQNAPNYGPCMEHVPYLNVTSYITTCILDIKYQGGTDWIQATLADFSATCLKEASKSENLTLSKITDDHGKTVSIFEMIEEASCPNNCSGYGICVKGECNCTDGYFGYNCAINRSTSPELVREAFDGECDIKKRPCQKFTIPGYNFIKGSLICNFTSYSIVNNDTTSAVVYKDTFSYHGLYKSSFLMYCQLPPSRRKRSVYSDTQATVYNITISNNGQDFTDELTVMVFDSSCYFCNASSLFCKMLDSCKSTPIDNEDGQQNTLIVVVAVAALVVALIVTVGLFYFRKNICNRQMETKVTDSLVDIKQNWKKC